MIERADALPAPVLMIVPSAGCRAKVRGRRWIRPYALWCDECNAHPSKCKRRLALTSTNQGAGDGKA